MIPNHPVRYQSHWVISALMLVTKYIFGDSPPARWGLIDFIRAVVLLLLLILLLRLLLLLPVSLVCTAGPQPGTFPAQCAPLDGPQPGTFPAQCAPLDLNLGPSQLSVHRWTSTWDLPSPACTAGPQPGTFPAQRAPLDLNGQIECQKICQIECQIDAR